MNAIRRYVRLASDASLAVCYGEDGVFEFGMLESAVFLVVLALGAWQLGLGLVHAWSMALGLLHGCPLGAVACGQGVVLQPR